MTQRQRLPTRERVFIESLKYHGFRKTRRRKNLKFNYGYVIPATEKEDATGTDFWIKMPRDERLFPVQITQRGIKIHREKKILSTEALLNLIKTAELRVREKKSRCYKHGIAFVLVSDWSERHTTPILAHSDIRALRFALFHLKRRL